MKLTESQLTEIIKNVIEEALDRATIKGANSYLNHKGGYTTNQKWDGLGGMARQAFGAKTDSNGQRDWENSANEIQGYIRQYTNEVKRLTRVYNAITGHVAQGWSDERKQKAAQTRALNKQWRADNGVDSTSAKYQNVGSGNGINTTKYDTQRQNLRGLKNDVAAQGNQKWFSVNESTDEGFLNNLFNRKSQKPDEVEQICQNYKQYIGNNDAAQKVLNKINEYKGIIQRLKGIIRQGIKGGHIQDVNKQNRNAMRAARGGQNTYGRVAESADFDAILKRNLSEAIKKYAL